MNSPRPPSFSATRALLTLCLLGLAHLLANAGCSSAAICFRHTDCPSGSDCEQGQCVRHRAASEANVAGSGSVDTGAAGASDAGDASDASDASQTPDAN